MKILEFTLPVPANKTIITKEESLPYFYPHLHRHKEVQLTWIISGEGTLVTGNTMHNFQSNDIFWIGANQSHVFKSDAAYFTNDPLLKTHSIDIFFNPDTQLASFFSIPEVSHLKSFTTQHSAGFKVPPNKVAELSKKVHAVRQSFGVEQFISFIDLLQNIASLQNLTALSTLPQNIAYTDNEGIRLGNIYAYIMQHFNQHITLEEVASLACMTPHAFCRYFKKHTHHTLVSFVNQVRINEACKKLVEHNYDSISSIAYNTGFNSITNFNRVFKSIVKKSPKEYIDSYYQSTEGLRVA